MPLFQLRQLSGFGDGVVEVTQAIDQTVALRVLTGPDVALRNFIDLFRRGFTGFRHQRDKALIAVFDAQLHHLRHFRRQRFGHRHVRQRRCCHAIRVNAQIIEAVFDGVNHAKDTDRTG
ncbi:hypothetical protein D3C71_1583810 [compost metagenome]